MNILFVNLSALRFTVATPQHEPLGGSESALCYLAPTLAQRGHAVAVAANLPDAAQPVINGVTHYPLSILTDHSFWPNQHFEVIILCNAPAAASPIRTVAPDAHILLWAHILPDQAALQALAHPPTCQAIDRIICVSDWQKQQIEAAYSNLPPLQVIGNGIAPAFENMFASVDDLRTSKQDRAIYASTPFRGLEVLVHAMNGLDRPTQLDVFSSMRVYQADDTAFASLWAQATDQPQITCHGAAAQPHLAQAFRGAAFLFYPCIFPETFCITAAEAMAAGAQIVATDLGALAQTTQGFATLVPLRSQRGEDLVEDFRLSMRACIDERAEDPTAWAEKRFAQSQRACKAYRWQTQALLWENTLRNQNK